MKPYLPLLSLVLLAACSTSYQNRQTPDDVYFSPAPPRVEYAKVEKRDDRRYNGNEDVALEDRYLQMKTRNRRYALLDTDCDCYGYTGNNYNRYYDYYRFNDYRYGYSYNAWNPHFSYYSPYYYNPYYANPYYGGYVVGNTRPVYNQPRKGNLNIYNGADNGSTGGSYSKPRSGSGSGSAGNYRNSGTDAGTNLRNTFGGSSSNNSGSSNSSSNSNSSNSSRSSSSSSGSSNAPVRKF